VSCGFRDLSEETTPPRLLFSRESGSVGDVVKEAAFNH
jgi:hypothetical protein